MRLDEFSKRLKELMELEGVSKRALSIKIQVDRASIRLWLDGRFYPRYDALIRLAEFFKVRIDELIGLENPTKDVVELTPTEEKFCEDVQAHFFASVTAYMEKERLTRYAFAKKLNLDQKALTNWFKKGSMPETTTIIRLSYTMKVSIDELLGRKV